VGGGVFHQPPLIVNLRGGDVLVVEEILNGLNRHTGIQQRCGVAGSECPRHYKWTLTKATLQPFVKTASGVRLPIPGEFVPSKSNRQAAIADCSMCSSGPHRGIFTSEIQSLKNLVRKSDSGINRLACRKIAWRVPRSISSWFGTVKLWLRPSANIRRSLT
jgi:hypothetical protein